MSAGESSKMLGLARQLFREGSYALCERLLHACLDDNRLDVETRLFLARTYAAMERFDLAVQSGQAALNLAQALGRDGVEIAIAVAEFEGERRKAEARSAVEEVPPPPPALELEIAARPPPKFASQEEQFTTLRRFSPYFGLPERPYFDNTNNYGFRYTVGTEPIDYPYRPAEDEYVIGIFGGSVASQFLQDTIEYMQSALAAHRDMAGRRVRFLQFAMGSVKQPLQLFYLNYFAALDQKLDLVINIDGFNDVRNAIVNLEFGHHFIMPQALITETLDAFASVPGLDEDYLRYFLEVVRLRNRIAAIESGKWGFLDVFGYLDRLKARSRELAAHPPQPERKMSLMHILPMDAVRFLDLGEEEQVRLAEEVIAVWFRCSTFMAATCERIGAKYVHAVQPNHFHLIKRTLTPLEEEWVVKSPLHDRGYATTKRVIEVCYPRMIELVRSLGPEVCCYMADVLQEVDQPVFLDGDCHFNEFGHHLMARRLCDHLLRIRLTHKLI